MASMATRPYMTSPLREQYRLRRRAIISSIQSVRLIAVAIVFCAIAVAYSSRDSEQIVFISMLPLLALQFFESALWRKLILVSSALRLINARMSPGVRKPSWLAGAGLAVTNTYFLLFVCFDSAWLLKAYVHPSPAAGLAEYIDRLTIGPIHGMGFVIFTIIFWAVYASLFIIGLCHSEYLDVSESIPADLIKDARAIERIRFSVEVEAHDNRRIHLNGLRMPREGGQPLILWPGFYQNGFCYDLVPNGGSLAEYLWERGFDIWIIHSRGTGGSSGRKYFCTLDDYAAFDIPAVIDYVAGHTAAKPIYVGHSQGGNTALMSLMGAQKLADGTVTLSDKECEVRQSKLKALVTLGSFLDFTFSKQSDLKEFVGSGVTVNLFGKKILIIKSSRLLKLLRIINFVPLPVSYSLREKMLEKRYLRILLAPLALTLNFSARLKVWKFLYNTENVSDKARRYILYRTIEGSFWGIIAHHYHALAGSAMPSFNREINYSANYHRLKLPVSFVSMELDTLADPAEMNRVMFESVSSSERHFAEWERQGHEDFFMNPEFFHLAHEAIQKVC
jgi:pimeloyl-ACP methyl ester carboxylesterase